mmetsp:Transcript_13713/g.21486  ORF Transcript_13713/g.21486 Transcript_13713/m.21486 type:complete len:113 (+) Transcript_13713:22-360(+)
MDSIKEPEPTQPIIPSCKPVEEVKTDAGKDTGKDIGKESKKEEEKEPEKWSWSTKDVTLDMSVMEMEEVKEDTDLSTDKYGNLKLKLPPVMKHYMRPTEDIIRTNGQEYIPW